MSSFWGIKLLGLAYNSFGTFWRTKWVFWKSAAWSVFLWIVLDNWALLGSEGNLSGWSCFPNNWNWQGIREYERRLIFLLLLFLIFLQCPAKYSSLKAKQKIDSPLPWNLFFTPKLVGKLISWKECLHLQLAMQRVLIVRRNQIT